MDVINTHLKELCNNQREVQRSVHKGLLCVQQCLEDRPSMSSVVLMLSSDVPLPSPNEPCFLLAEVDSVKLIVHLESLANIL